MLENRQYIVELAYNNLSLNTSLALGPSTNDSKTTAYGQS